MLYETKFLISLLLTLIIEIPVLFILTKIVFKLKIKNSRILFAGLIASILTLPYLWFILPNYINTKYYIYTGELIVFLVEAIIYWQLLEIKFRRAMVLSFIANLLSFIIGYSLIWFL